MRMIDWVGQSNRDRSSHGDKIKNFLNLWDAINQPYQSLVYCCCPEECTDENSKRRSLKGIEACKWDSLTCNTFFSPSIRSLLCYMWWEILQSVTLSLNDLLLCSMQFLCSKMWFILQDLSYRLLEYQIVRVYHFDAKHWNLMVDLN